MSAAAAKIADYGLIGDGRTAALVSKQGSIDWGCFPSFDSPSYFAALLDPEKGGFFSIRPIGNFDSTHAYLEDTNVLETHFRQGQSSVTLRDAFTVTSEARKKDRLWPDHEILRTIEAVGGTVRMRMEFFPRPNYADPKTAVRFLLRGKLGWAAVYGRDLLMLRSSLPVEAIHSDGQRLWAEFEIKAGERILFSLLYTNEAPGMIVPLGDHALARMDETIRYWKQWVSRCRYQGAYAASVRRSALALRLLIFAPSGAITAAPTTSLPETPGGTRNWDYRYCWLRDASFTVRALMSLGFEDEARAFVSWMLHATRLTRPKLQVLYTVYGESRVKESVLTWLSGYAQARPVRIGNAAYNQFQLDIYGEVLDAVFECAPLLETLDHDTRDLILGIGRGLQTLWDQPDDGIWEFRSGRAHHTHSKALAWVGFDRLIRLSERYGWNTPVVNWKQSSAQLRTQIESRGYNAELQSYTQTLDGRDLDASLLVLPLVGYCEASAERMQSTCAAIAWDLSEGGLFYRYRRSAHGETVQDGCFGLCTFWYIENLARSGKLAEAHQALESIFRRRNPLDLWSEMIDVKTGDFLGNYPQGFTHIGLINAAVTLDKAEQRVGVTA